MHQLNQILVLASYCLELGRPEAVWESLVEAVSIVEREIPDNQIWLNDREGIRSVLAELWNRMNDDVRASLAPYEAWVKTDSR